MENIKLIFPTKEYKKEILDYKEEFRDNLQSMNGSSNLREIEDFDEWYQGIIAKQNGEIIDKYHVPATNYIAIRESDNKIIGFVDIRHQLNEFFMNYAGHIGYSVRKSERRKGYAKLMLNLALEKCKELSIDKVLITCAKGNIASAKTILSQGGIYENEILKENGDIMKRYWIKLK